MESNAYKETWFIVPSYVVDLPGMTLAYLKIYQSIFQFWNKGRECWSSNACLKKMSGIASSSTISHALQFFENNKLLIRKEIDGKRYLCSPSMYIRQDDNGVDPSQDRGLAKSRGGVSQNREGGSRKIETEIKNINKETNKEKNITKKESAIKPVNYKETLYPLPSNESCTGLDPTDENNRHEIPKKLIDEWKTIRKAKRSPVTPTVWRRINDELDKCPNPLEAFEIMIERGWSTLKVSWLTNFNKSTSYDDESTDWTKRSSEVF